MKPTPDGPRDDARQTDDEVAYIGLGSNLGDRRAHLDGAVDGLDRLPGIRVEAVSSPIETAPVGPPGQGPYLNAAARLRTSRSPEALLEAMLAIERAHGRVRRPDQRWGPRTLDLDLLLFGERTVLVAGLEVPHPRLHEREFVLLPLAEVGPEAVHPGLDRTVRELLADLAARAAAPE